MQYFVIDDDPQSLKQMRQTLESLKIVPDRCFTNPKEALTEILKHKEAVIFLDMLMPEVPGPEVMRRLYTNPGYIIVIVSAHSDFDYAQEGISNRAVAYVTKPYNQNGIQQALLKVDERLAGDRSTDYMFQKKGMMYIYRWAGGRVLSLDASLQGAYYIHALLSIPHRRYPVVTLSSDLSDQGSTLKDKERAKGRVRNCINTALAKIKPESDALYIHLNRSIQVGVTGAIYSPEVLPPWTL